MTLQLDKQLKNGWQEASEHLLLRSMTEEDAQAYRLLRNRDDNSSFFFTKEPISAEQQQSWFATYREKPDEYMFSILEKEGGRFLGGIGVYRIDSGKHSAEIGRLLVDRMLAGGCGYGAEAIACLCRLIRRRLGTQRFYASIYATNRPSIRSVEKAGFVIGKTEAGKENICCELIMETESHES